VSSLSGISIACCLVVLIQYMLVMDGRMDGHTTAYTTLAEHLAVKVYVFVN